MSVIKMGQDVENLKTRVAAIEAKAEAVAGEVVTVVKADWEALLARLEAVEAKLKAT